jgi:hypothetical protein
MHPGMSWIRPLVAVPLLSVSTFGRLPAQNPNAAPPVIQVGIETVRAGRAGAHTALEQQWAQTFRQANAPVYWLGATTETGPNEAWYFTPLGAVGELEAQDKAVAAVPGLEAASGLLSHSDAENVSETRSFIARYREDLSLPGPMSVATGRYFSVLIFRVRPGHESDFEQAAKLYRTVVTDAKANANWTTYQVASGMPGPTFMVFRLMKSLAEMDPGPDDAAMQKAMTADRTKMFNQLSSAGIISTTDILLRFAPRMSYLPKDFTDQDPGFWVVKP